MKGTNDEKNLIEMLRDITEEKDLNQILKSTFGGYTKKSILEYLATLRKQQQTSQETFQKNLQTLFEEKESLRKSNEALLARHNKLSAEYDNLAESLKNIKIDDSEFSAQSVVLLKSNILSLEEELKVTNREKQTLEKKIEHLNNEISSLQLKIEQSVKENDAMKEMLKVEKQESKKQRDMVADISRQLEEEKMEVKYLKSTMSDGKYAELNSKISELTQQMSAQTEVIAKFSKENELKEKTIDTLNDEIGSLKHRLSSMIQQVQSSNLQNDKLLVANDLLKTQLQEEYAKSISLINEKADIAIDKLISQKNLSIVEAKITSMELQLEKFKKSQGVHIIQNKLTENAE